MKDLKELSQHILSLVWQTKVPGKADSPFKNPWRKRSGFREPSAWCGSVLKSCFSLVYFVRANSHSMSPVVLRQAGSVFSLWNTHHPSPDWPLYIQDCSAVASVSSLKKYCPTETQSIKSFCARGFSVKCASNGAETSMGQITSISINIMKWLVKCTKVKSLGTLDLIHDKNKLYYICWLIKCFVGPSRLHLFKQNTKSVILRYMITIQYNCSIFLSF